MSFFDAVREMSYESPVTLMINEESVVLSEAQYRGKTVSQLFAEYASGIVDVSRVNRYIINGTAVSGDTVIRPGEICRGSVNSESKGVY
jgi:hypothetical protein